MAGNGLLVPLTDEIKHVLEERCNARFWAGHYWTKDHAIEIASQVNACIIASDRPDVDESGPKLFYATTYPSMFEHVMRTPATDRCFNEVLDNFPCHFHIDMEWYTKYHEANDNDILCDLIEDLDAFVYRHLKETIGAKKFRKMRNAAKMAPKTCIDWSVLAACCEEGSCSGTTSKWARSFVGSRSTAATPRPTSTALQRSTAPSL
jgi:hypothetical protein